MAGAYAGTTTLMWSTVFGNKKVSLLKVDITNYFSTGIPLTEVIAAMDTIEAVIPTITGILNHAEAPIQGSYIAASDVVYLYKAVNSQVTDDFNLNTNAILVYLLVIGV
jgi:hypothetical protein